MGQGIVGLVRDLFFSSKIAETAKALGYPYLVATTESEFFSRLDSARPGLLIIDLTTPSLDFSQLFDALEARDPGVPVLAFTTHALWRATGPVHARCQKVMTKEALAEAMPEILRSFLSRSL